MIHESLQKSNIFFWSWMTGPSWLDHFHNHHLDYYCKTVTTAKTDSTVSRVDWTETKSTFIVQDLLNMLIPSKQWRWHCLWLKNFCHALLDILHHVTKPIMKLLSFSPYPSWNYHFPAPYIGMHAVKLLLFIFSISSRFLSVYSFFCQVSTVFQYHQSKVTTEKVTINHQILMMAMWEHSIQMQY